jgi:hypothetical protein
VSARAEVAGKKPEALLKTIGKIALGTLTFLSHSRKFYIVPGWKKKDLFDSNFGRGVWPVPQEAAP